MATLKTAPNDASVREFVESIPDEDQRRDSVALMRILKRATNARPKMWGPSIVGYGSYHYRYASGREGDWFLAGFSPRKGTLVIYIMAGFGGYAGLMRRLGKHKTGRSCLYVKRLADVDAGVLEELVRGSVAYVRQLSKG